ncbi:MAG: hypothetical protein ACFFD4_40725, partial [Candidatus Odinarchaeota archaeon]
SPGIVMFFPWLEIDDQIAIDSDPDAAAEFKEWQETMRQYALEADDDGGVPHKFLVVIRVRAENYSEKLAYHETLPMWIPKEGEGELAGIALNSDGVDKIISGLTDQSTGENRYVYLVYVVKVQGQQAWRGLLEYLGSHNMLEKY